MTNSFHKDHPDKPTVTSLIVNTTLPMAGLTIKPIKPIQLKRKYSCPAKTRANK